MKLIIEYEIPEDYEDVHPDLIVSDSAVPTAGMSRQKTESPRNCSRVRFAGISPTPT